MLCCLAFAHCDADVALRNARWMAQIDVGRGHEALVICNIEAKEKGLHEPVIEEMTKTFSKVHFTTCTEDERQWPQEQRKWPWPQNLTFTSCARYVRDHLRVPWLFLEADAVLLYSNALNDIDGEYHVGGKPFLGMLVDTRDETGSKVPAHMSGVAVYPPDVSKWSDKALQGGGLAFDMVLKDVTVPNMVDSRLFHHCYKSPAFDSVEDLRRIRKGAALYHQDKTGSLLALLSAQSGLPVSIPSRPSKTIPEPSSRKESPSPMITDILIKTYPKDYPWLVHCLRSIDKFATGFRNVVLVLPDHGEGIVVPHGLQGRLHLKVEPDQEPGYLHQMSVKMHADKYTDADHVLFMDSDCVFTRPVTPLTYMRDGRVIWLKTPIEKSGTGIVWLESMRAWFGSTPTHEYMRRHPFLFPRWLFTEMRNFTTFLHGKTLEEYIMASGEFSEFNCAGMLAEAKYKDKFLFLDTTRDEIPEPTVRQWHSHDGVDTALEEIEAIMGTETLQPVNVDQLRVSMALDAHMHPNPPTEAEAKQMVDQIMGRKPDQNPLSFAIATLCAEAQKSGLHKARVFAALVAAGLREKKEKPKAMKRSRRKAVVA